MKITLLQNKIKAVNRFSGRYFFFTPVLMFLMVYLFLPSTISAGNFNDKSLLSSCCIGIRGNVDNDTLEQINISDLVSFVAYMFSSGDEPLCMEEADVDVSGGIDISDLVLLVAYMFSGGVAPIDCPTKTFGGTGEDKSFSVCKASNGGYMITGHTWSFGIGGAVYLIKTDDNGASIWEKTYGGGYFDTGYSIGETSDGGYIITGWTWSFGALLSDLYLVKVDSNGNLDWEKSFRGTDYDYGYSVIETSDGGYIITGSTSSFGTGSVDLYLVKVDNSGALIWEKNFGGPDIDKGFSIVETVDSCFIITGLTRSFGTGSEDVYLIKVDNSGTLIWEKTFGGTSSDYGSSIITTSDSGFIVVGETHSFGLGSSDVYLLKIDINGNLSWEKTFGGTGEDFGLSVIETSDNNYILAGMKSSGGVSGGDVYLIKTDNDGTLLWEQTIGGAGYEYGYSLLETPTGGYIITGSTTSSGAGSFDVYFIKTDSEGNVY